MKTKPTYKVRTFKIKAKAFENPLSSEYFQLKSQARIVSLTEKIGLLCVCF